MARPLKTFEGFIGQPGIVTHLKRMVNGARKLGRPLPSLLLVGRSGFGKNALAEATTAAMGVSLRTVFASERTRAEDLYAELRELSHADVLFIDEAHSLLRDPQQALFRALDARMIPALDEKGRAGRELQSVADHTLILATNFPGQLRNALRQRLTSLSFSAYSDGELIAIARRVAKDARIVVTPQAARLIAKTSQGSPRRVKQRVEAIQFFSPHTSEYSVETVREYLVSEGIDEDSLTELQRSYLQILANSRNGSHPLQHIVTSLGLDARYVREDIEHFLITQDYVVVTSNSHRMITTKGRDVVTSSLAIKEIA